MDVANKNEPTSRKNSAIPRLHSKQNTIETIPEKFTEDVKNECESCFCTGCRNRCKKFCRSTRNDKRIRNLRNDSEEGKQSYNDTEDDEVNSMTTMTDRESHCSENNCVDGMKKDDYNRWRQASFIIQKVKSNEPNSQRNESSTIESKKITKRQEQIPEDFESMKLRLQNEDPEKFRVKPDGIDYTSLRKSNAKSAGYAKGNLVKVSTRNRLKYTLTNVTKFRPKTEETCPSGECSGSSSRCITPTELNLEEREETISDLTAAKVLDGSNSKNGKEANLFNQDLNLNDYLHESDNDVLSHLFKTGNLWNDDLQASTPKSTTKENKSDFLINALLEVFGSNSHITQKIRNSTLAKDDIKCRNIRSLGDYNLNVESSSGNKITVRKSPFRENDFLKKNLLQSKVYNNDESSIHTLPPSLEKSSPKTFSPTVPSTDTDLSKYDQKETYISLKRCKCQNVKCYQLDKLNESITSMQTEIKTLIKSMPCGKKCSCTISKEIAKLKQFREECLQSEQKRNLLQRKLECDIKEIYRRMDELKETKRGPSFFKYFVLLPSIGILTVYTVSCLEGLRKN